MMAPYLAASGEPQKLDRCVAQIARVFAVEGNRIGAAQLVTKGLVHDADFECGMVIAFQFGDPLGQTILDHAAELDFSQPQVAVRIALENAVAAQRGEVHGGQQSLLADGFQQPFGKHGDPEMIVLAAALEDRPEHDVAELVQFQFFIAELFGDDGYRGSARFADAQCQETGCPAHADDDVPA